MTNFTFNTTKSIICEVGMASRLGPIVKEQIGSVVQVVTDPGLVASGLLQPTVDSLEGAGVSVHTFEEVVADPPTSVVMAAVEQAKSNRVTGVIGFGGGSSMDVAKLVALLVAGGESLDDIYGVGLAKGKRLPLVQIPTTAGTGSEVTPVSIVTVGATEKKGVVAPQLLPDIAVLDAELTVGLPPNVTAVTGYDAMIHAIEAFTSKSPNNNPISRVLAREALKLLGANIETAFKDGKDLSARSAMLLGSMLAGQAFANSPVAAVHALAYPLGGIFHVPHGLSTGLLLPQVMAFNSPVCGDAYATIALDVFPELNGVSQEALTDTFIERMAALRSDLGMQTRMRDVEVPESDLALMASESMKQTRLLVNNPRSIDEGAALQIYRAAW